MFHPGDRLFGYGAETFLLLTIEEYIAHWHPAMSKERPCLTLLNAHTQPTNLPQPTETDLPQKKVNIIALAI